MDNPAAAARVAGYSTQDHVTEGTECLSAAKDAARTRLASHTRDVRSVRPSGGLTAAEHAAGGAYEGEVWRAGLVSPAG
jgi:hypothetical protein